MVPFKEVLSEVRKVLQEENLLPSLLAQLVEAQIFSAQYYQTFISENLCDVDVDEMARRLALPVWEKWDASKVILSSVLMENEPENHEPADIMTNVDHGETPPDRLLDLIVSTPLEEFPFEEFLDTSYSDEVWDAVADGSEDKATLVCEVYDKISPARKVHKRKRREVGRGSEKTPRSKRSKRDLIPSLPPKSSETAHGFNTTVQEGDFHNNDVSSLIHFPLTIATTASLMPSGAPAMQIIQTFSPLSSPVIKSILPVGHTYVLVSPQSLTPMPVPQIAPLSPLDGTVAPLELSMFIQPASSLSDSASRSQSPSQSAPVPPSKEKSPKEHLPATQDIKKMPVIPENVQIFIKRFKSHLGETCSMMQEGMSMESHYIDTPLVQRKLIIRTGKNANKCLEKELVVLSDSERKKGMMHRSHVFQNCGSNNKHLITVLGKAGMGKSTLIQRLALDWSSGGLQQFQFIFLLNCKVLNLTQSSFSLKSLLFDSSTCPRCDDSEAVFKHVLAFPENVLVVFDSFDELKDLEGLLQSPATSPTDGNYSVRQLFSGLFQKRILSGCTVLIVTRPKDVLNQLLRKVDRILEICCFSPKDIEMYVSNYFGDESEREDTLRKIKKQKYIFSLCSNPLLCRLTCCVAKHQTSGGLPSTLTDLYQRVLSQCLELNDDLQGSRQDFVKLCNVAWDGFKTQNSLLNQNQNQNLLDYGLSSGILMTHSLNAEQSNRQVTYFANLFVQNLLSALFLVHSRELNDKTLLAQTTLHQRKKKFQGEWQNVLQQFTMGLLFQKNSPPCCRVFQNNTDLQAKRKAVEVHLENLKPGELIPSRLLELFHCVYEAKNVKLAKLLVKNLPDNLSFCGAQLSPVDHHVVWHLLSQTKGLKRTFSIDLRDTCVPLGGLKELVALDIVASFRAPTMDTINLWEDLHRSSDQPSLKNSIKKFTINPLKVSQVSHVEDLVVLVQIHNEKKLPLCEVESALEDGVPAVRQLHKLEYELGQQHGPEVFLQLVEILPALQSLHHLDLENNKMGDDEAEQLAGVLSSLSSLKLLNLSQNCIGDGGVQRLSETLPSASSLQSLSLYGNMIGDSGAESLASVLPLMTSLLDLDVKYNKFTDVGAKKLGAALKNSSSVTSLQMWNDCIPFGVLEHLQIQDCRIN
ncbi:MHC class II transactivator isoform X2 [Tachysurus vachellii]|uniref:MHC class II transactivator isoform X2 n=1 Tax=Tachysurus vachellii TaxID=175792 RepID=UPI00296B0998|nr:MHC class II transactivator isoform X2 [Tachysurus vachellii]